MSDPNNSTDQLPQLPAPIRWLCGGAVRHSIAGLGAYLLGAHILPNQSAENQFVNWAVGAVMIILGLGWSFLNEKSKTSSNK